MRKPQLYPMTAHSDTLITLVESSSQKIEVFLFSSFCKVGVKIGYVPKITIPPKGQRVLGIENTNT